MKATKKRAQNILNKIASLGPIMPGSISIQWNTCGKKDCCCKSKDKPRKHGPYYQLSYTLEGKSSTAFISKEQLLAVRKRIAAGKKFRQLHIKLLQEYVGMFRQGEI